MKLNYKLGHPGPKKEGTAAVVSGIQMHACGCLNTMFEDTKKFIINFFFTIQWFTIQILRVQ